MREYREKSEISLKEMEEEKEGILVYKPKNCLEVGKSRVTQVQHLIHLSRNLKSDMAAEGVGLEHMLGPNSGGTASHSPGVRLCLWAMQNSQLQRGCAWN